MTWSERIERLTTAKDHIDFLRTTASKFDVKGEDYVAQELKAVEQKLDDKNLYLAIVGRASTGKSTLINALLGANLLKAGVLTETTSIATQLRWGEKIGIAVQFKDKGDPWLKELKKDKDELALKKQFEINGDSKTNGNWWRVCAAEEPFLFNGTNYTMSDLVELISTSEEWAQRVEYLIIYYPSEFLRFGIVVIDTPGADAQNPNHKKISRKVVEHSDTAIVVTPGEQAVSNWLTEILMDEGFLNSFIHRCVFLVTRMDIAVERMRKTNRREAIQLLKKDTLSRLDKVFVAAKVKPDISQFHFCAAQAVIDQFEEEPLILDEKERVYWQDEFAKFQNELVRYMLYIRAETIAETVLRLLGRVFGFLEMSLSGLWEDYKSKSNSLSKIVEDLDRFCEDRRAECKRKIKKEVQGAVENIEISLTKIQEKCLIEVRQEIYSANSMEELSISANEATPKIMNRNQEKVEASIHYELQKNENLAQDLYKSFDESFKEIYTQLELLGHRKRNSSSELEKINSMNGLNKEISLSNTELLYDNTSDNKNIGAVVGGIVGSIVTFGVGTFVGIALGRWIGSLFGPSIEERRSQAWQELEPQIQGYFRKVINGSKELVHEQRKNCTNSILSHINLYSKHYGETVRQLRKKQHREKEQLNSQQEQIEHYLLDLRRRQEALADQQRDLKVNLILDQQQ